MLVHIGELRVIHSTTVIIPEGEEVVVEFDFDDWRAKVRFGFEDLSDDKEKQRISIKPVEEAAQVTFHGWTNTLGTATVEPIKVATVGTSSALFMLVSHHCIGKVNKMDVNFFAGVRQMTNNDQSNGGNERQFLPPEFLEVEQVHGISSQNLILTTEDRLYRRLYEHQEALIGNKAWMVPASAVIPILITLVTADFRRFLFDAQTWKAAFILVAVACSIWAVREWCKRKSAPSLDDLVEKIKETTRTPE